MTADQQGDYETRDVDYSLIHGETKEVFSKFIGALQLKNNMHLLDLGGGYGSVLTHILENQPHISFNYDLLDNSKRQLEKAEQHITSFLKNKTQNVTINYIHQSAVKMELSANHYDVVVCKMFIHEIPSHKTDELFKNIFSVLKPGGHVIFWLPDLDEHDHYFYKETIRKKDELAKFEKLVKNRHFLQNPELVEHLEKAGFSDIQKLFSFDYNLNTSLRLKAEFDNNGELLKVWNDHILKISETLEPGLKNNLLADISGNNIHIRFKRAVFKAAKT